MQVFLDGNEPWEEHMTEERQLAVLEHGPDDRRQPGGSEQNVPGVTTDYWVTVCSACRCASCWHGEFMCGWGRTASTVEMLASVLRIEGREHRDNFSEEKLKAVCGSVRYAT